MKLNECMDGLRTDMQFWKHAVFYFNAIWFKKPVKWFFKPDMDWNANNETCCDLMQCNMI